MPEQHISAEDKTDLTLEIAHLLFIDVVGYSKLLVTKQTEQMQKLREFGRSEPRTIVIERPPPVHSLEAVPSATQAW